MYYINKIKKYNIILNNRKLLLLNAYINVIYSCKFQICFSCNFSAIFALSYIIVKLMKKVFLTNFLNRFLNSKVNMLFDYYALSRYFFKQDRYISYFDQF